MRNKLIILAVVVAVIAAIYFLFLRKKAPLKPGAQVGAQKVTAGPSSNSITNLAISGIKALTSTPTNKGSIQASSSSSDDDDDSSDDSSSDDDDA